MSRELKDSGIPWIGEIPKEWTIGRMKNYFHLHGRIGWNGLRSEEFEEESYAYLVTGQDFVAKDIDWKKCYQIRKERYDEDEYIQLKEGDILVTKDGTIGKVAIVSNLDKPACLNSGIFVIKQYEPKHYNSNYLYWLLVAPLLKTYNDFINLGGTTIIHLYQNVFERMPLVLPLLAEQQAIADFLDRKCADVDEMIALQEQIIEELKAYKQSVITEAVTKGLNPDAPMKDSGIEWIGEIPEHWDVHPFKAYYKTTKGLNITKENLVESGVPVISYGQIHSKLNTGTSISNELIRYVPETYLDSNPECLSKKFDMFFADTSEDREGAGNVAFIDIDTPVFAGYHTIIARPNDEIKTKYFAYLTKTDAWRTQIRNSVSGVKVFSISQKLINRAYIIIPSPTEQQAIADYLDEKCGDIDSLIQTKQSKIDSLKEYKKSIIYEYVTGKREVE